MEDFCRIYIFLKRVLRAVSFFVSVGLVYGCASSHELDYDCEFLPETEAPAWLSGGHGKLGKKYVGVGVSGRRQGGPDAQIKAAEFEARASLARAVHYSWSGVEDVNQAHTFSDESVKSSIGVIKSTEATTNIVVRKSTVTGSWLDQENCLYWIRVEVDESVITGLLARQEEERRRIAKLKSDIILIESNKSDPVHSLSYIPYLNNSLESIDFSIFPFDRKDLKGELVARIRALEADLQSEVLKNENEIRKQKEAIREKNDRKAAQKMVLEIANGIEEINRNYSPMGAKISSSRLNSLVQIFDEFVSKGFERFFSKKAQEIRKYFSRFSSGIVKPKDRFRVVLGKMGDPDDIMSNKWITICVKGYDQNFLFSSCDESLVVDYDKSQRFAYKYGNFWIIFENGIVQCEINEAYIGIQSRTIFERDLRFLNKEKYPSGDRAGDYFNSCPRRK